MPLGWRQSLVEKDIQCVLHGPLFLFLTRQGNFSSRLARDTKRRALCIA